MAKMKQQKDDWRVGGVRGRGERGEEGKDGKGERRQEVVFRVQENEKSMEDKWMKTMTQQSAKEESTQVMGGTNIGRLHVRVWDLASAALGLQRGS